MILMKPFKFFEPTKKLPGSLHGLRREIPGHHRGVINWMTAHAGVLYFDEPIYNDDLSIIEMTIVSEPVMVQEFRVNSLIEFLTRNNDKYIFIYQIIDPEGNIYDQINIYIGHILENNIRLTIRGIIRD